MLRLHSEARGEMENILSQHQCYTSACSADRTLIICLFILERVEDSCLSLTRATEREDKQRSGCHIPKVFPRNSLKPNFINAI
jgi:hypothetical protein